MTPTLTFEHPKLKNCKVHFDAHGCYVSVSLNITPAMVGVMSKNNVRKDGKLNLYRLQMAVKDPSYNSVHETYKTLLHRNMEACRVAKIEVIKKEIEVIKHFKI